MANYWVVEADNGGWGVKGEGAQRAAYHPTQQEAIAAAHPRIKNSGGGELIVQGRDGKIREKHTIGKPDPFPPAG